MKCQSTILHGSFPFYVVLALIMAGNGISPFFVIGQTGGGDQNPAAGQPEAANQDEAWIHLFDGQSLDAFRGYGQEEIGKGWKIEDGVLVLDGTAGSGDIVTRDTFDDFELRFEWKISPGGNSGVMYRVRLGDGAPYFSGPEFQILDDEGHHDGHDRKTSAAALYGLYAPQHKVQKPAGEWNTAKIVMKGNHVEHWLNGTRVVAAEIGSDDWNQRVNASKFKAWPQFAKTRTGHIAFQDHGNPVSYRNIRIRKLQRDDRD